MSIPTGPRSPLLRGHLTLALTLAMTIVLPSAPVMAQASQDAAVQVYRGEVALVRGDGSAVQPMPSGTAISPGDELRAVSAGGASVGIVNDIQMELQQGTILVFGGKATRGEQVNVLLTQVQGASETTVAFPDGSASSVNLIVGGAVAVVSQGVLAVVGPEDSPDGTVVGLTCLLCLTTDFVEDIDFDQLNGSGSAQYPGEQPAFRWLVAQDAIVSVDEVPWEIPLVPTWDFENDEYPLIAASRSRTYVGARPPVTTPAPVYAVLSTDPAVQSRYGYPLTLQQQLERYYGIVKVTHVVAPNGRVYTVAEVEAMGPGGRTQALGTNELAPVTFNFGAAVTSLQDRLSTTLAFSTSKTKPPVGGGLQPFPIQSGLGLPIGGIGGLGKFPATTVMRSGFVGLKEPFAGSALGAAQQAVQSMAALVSKDAKNLHGISIGIVSGLSNSNRGLGTLKKGKDDKPPAVGQAPGQIPTTTTLLCNRVAANLVACIARVTNALAGSQIAPIGQVRFTAQFANFFNGQECNLVQSGPNTSECQLGFEAPNTIVNAQFLPGSAQFLPSNATPLAI